MRVRLYPQWLAKAGNAPHEYEDAFWPARSSVREAGSMRCAVADGATEASFSGLWAARLVQAYGRGRLRPSRLVDGLAPLQRAWRDEVSGQPLPWYAEEKMKSGAFSSLLGLTLTVIPGEPALHWTALAVGDTCLFVVRAGELMTSMPLGSSQSFDNSPHLIASLPARNRGLETVVRRERGRAERGDHLFLLTDALAHWFLARYEDDAAPWVMLDTFARDGSEHDFAEWIGVERDARRLRNDDVTMLHLRLE